MVLISQPCQPPEIRVLLADTPFVLAAAGLLRRSEGAYVGPFWHGLAPNFRRGVEAGQVEVRDLSESATVACFLASCSGLSFMPVKAIVSTDMAKQDPALVTEMVCPFTGEIYAAVRAVEADFTIMHGYRADRFGNVQWPLARDADDIDQIIARGSRCLIVTVEEIVEHDEITRQPNLTYIPAQWVEAVVEAPFGAHPLACDTIYNEDEDALRAYVEAGSTREGAGAYLDEYVRRAATHDDYLARSVVWRHSGAAFPSRGTQREGAVRDQRTAGVRGLGSN